MSKPSLVSVLLLVTVLALATTLVSAETITVDFGGTTVDATVFDYASVRNFYNFESGSSANEHGIQTKQASVFAFVRGSNNGELGLVNIYDIATTGTAGNIAYWAQCVGHACNPTLIVTDDSSEKSSPNGQLPYGAKHKWVEKYTDGFAHDLGACGLYTYRYTEANNLPQGAKLLSSTGGLTWEVIATSSSANVHINFEVTDNCPPAPACIAEYVSATIDGQPVTAQVFDAKSKGYTLAEWYNYRQSSAEPLDYSAATAEHLETADTAVYAFVRGTDGLGLAVIFDKPSDNSGGRATIDGTCEGPSCDSLVYIIADDGHEGPAAIDINTGSSFSGSWRWWPCCTDGYMLGHFGGCQTMNMQLRNTQGLNTVAIASSTCGLGWEFAGSAAVTAPLSFALGETCEDPVDPVSGGCQCESFTAGVDCTTVQASAQNTDCICITFSEDAPSCTPASPDGVVPCPEEAP